MMKRLGLPIVFVIVLVAATCLTSRAQTSEDTFSGAVDAYFAAIEAYDSGKSEEAIRGLKQALKVFQRDQSEKGEFMVYLSLAEIYGNEAKYDRAMSELEKALELKRRARDFLGEGVVLLRMGDLEMDRSRFKEARKHLEGGLAKAKAMEDHHLTAIIKTSLAEVLIVNGELKEAQALLEDAIPVHEKTGDAYHQALALMRLADIETIRNRYDKAFELLSQAKEMTSHEKFDALHHEILGRMALVLRNQGRLEEARAKLEESAEFFHKAGQRHESASAKSAMASIMMKEGRVREALDSVQDASGEFRRLEADYEGANNMVLQARLLMRTGRLTEAMKSVEKALGFFTEKRAPMSELSARIILARLELAQGRPIAALLNADRAGELALRLGTPQGQADAMFVRGRVHAASGNHEAAFAEFGKALELYQTLKNVSAEARCRIRRAESLIAAGFPEQARKDIDAVEELPALKDDLFVRGHLLLLKAALAHARGNDSMALTELDKAEAVLGKLSTPLIDATLLERKAKSQISNRNYYAALELLEKAEKIFTQAESPGGIIRCRAARISMALDRNYLRDAQSIARKGLKIPWQRGYGSQKKDPDAALLEARLSCLRARVKLASGDTGDAEKEAAKARETAEELKSSSVAGESAALLARIYAAEGKYDKALEQLEKSSDPIKWRAGHAQAMTMVAQGKIEEALPIFNDTIVDLTARELGEGLRNVPAHLVRERELLYEDYIDALVAAGRKAESPMQLATAWDVGQRLKMRRLLYLGSAVGAELFPGVPQTVLSRLKRLQADAVNRVKRAAFPVLNKEMGDKGATGEGGKPQGPYSRVNDFLTETGKKHPQLAALLLGQAPSSSAVAARLQSGERYVTILATRKHYHLFLVGQDGIKAAAVSPDAQSVVGQADAVSKGISNPYYYKIDKRAADLWATLFGTFATEINSGKSFIIETDGRLTVFPFEVLVPGEFPDSYQEQQTVPILLEKSAIVRTTSAFRFVRGRDRPKTAPPSKLIVFASPAVPKDSSNGSSEGALLVSTWKRTLAGFDSPTASEEANVFGENAKVFAGDRAIRSSFLENEAARSTLIHLACPVLFPRDPAGRLLQPFVVFSPEKDDAATAFCGISDLSSTMLPAEGIVIPWVGRNADNTDEALFLLLESLGLAGTGWIVLPLWQADRQGEADTISFMTTFYGALKNGDAPAAALTKARQAIKPDSSRKNRCNPARMALF